MAIIKKSKNQTDDYINSKYEEVRNHNLRTNKEIEELKSILDNGIKRYKCISIDEFIKKDIKELVLPDELLSPNPKPTKPQIKKANLMEKFIKPHKEKYSKYAEELQIKYISDYKLYEERENKVLEQINNIKKEYDLYANSIINNKLELFNNANPEFISSYKKHIFNNSYYPFDHNRKIDVKYLNESKELVINYLLPKRDIIPPIKEYEYIKSMDKIAIKERSLNDINDLYKEVIFSITLRTIYEGFNSNAKEHINSIVFNGYIEDGNEGNNLNQCIISLRTFREDFNSINLSEIDKYEFLTNMNANLVMNSNLEFDKVDPIG